MIKTKVTKEQNINNISTTKKVIQPIIGVALIIFWILISSTILGSKNIVGGDATKLMANALIGLAIGYILQRSFFGFAGTVNRTANGSPKLAYAVLILFGLGAIIVSILWGSKFAPGFNFNSRPISLGTIIGSALFGMGMVMAKACASGILTDISTGSVFIIIVLVFFIIGSGPGQLIQDVMNGNASHSGLTPMKATNGNHLGKQGHTGLGTDGINLLDKLGIAGGVIITILFLAFLALAAHVVARKVRENKNAKLSKVELSMGETEDIFKDWSSLNGFQFEEEPKLFSAVWFRGIYFNVFAKKWNLFLGALILLSALVGVMLINGKGWGVTTSFARWFQWIFQTDVFHGGKHGLNAGGILTDPGSFRNFGIAIGAVAYILMANKFKFRNELKGISMNHKIIKISIAATAGFLLGFGARVADGCNAGQLATGIMTFSLSSWLFAIGMIGGGIGGIFIIKLINKKSGLK